MTKHDAINFYPENHGFLYWVPNSLHSDYNLVEFAELGAIGRESNTRKNVPSPVKIKVTG